MNDSGIFKLSHNEILSFEEILNVIKVASKLGIRKVRFTGGEPLVRKGILSLISKTKNIEGIEEVCLTTNGTLLSGIVKDLKSAGLDRINISIDTLDENKYKTITRCGELKDALSGIESAISIFDKVKINTVLIGGFNDDEIVNLVSLSEKKNIDVRFIELMPMVEDDFFSEKSFISCDKVLDELSKNNIHFYKVINNKINVSDKSIENIDSEINNYEKNITNLLDNSVASLYKVEGFVGYFGLISALSHNFCKNCNRIRLTTDGNLKPCLHSNEEISIKGLNEQQIEERLKEAIQNKPKEHKKLGFGEISGANRHMNEIGG